MENQLNSLNIPPHKSLTHWLVVAVAIIAVIGYFMTSYAFNLWPFQNVSAPVMQIGTGPQGLPDWVCRGENCYNEEDTHNRYIRGKYFWCEEDQCFACGGDGKQPCSGAPVVEVDPFEGWKTYTNTEYGFEFKYPSTFMHKTEYGRTYFDRKEVFDTTGCNAGMGSPFCGVSFEGSVKSSSIDKAIDAIQHNREYRLESVKRILGDNVFTVVKRFNPPVTPEPQWFYLIETKGIILQFFVQQAYEETANQILSTFRFVDETGYKTEIINGDVYLSGTLIAKSVPTTDEELKKYGVSRLVIYSFAKVSPSNRFILLGGTGWESFVIQVYDIESKTIKRINVVGDSDSEWLSDSRIRIEADNAMAGICAIYESADSVMPWIMKKVADCPVRQ